MKMKQYLIGYEYPRGDGTKSITKLYFYTDTPDKNIRLSADHIGDCGLRYQYLGHAARMLESSARQREKWGYPVTRIYGTFKDLPLRGSNAPYVHYSDIWHTFVDNHLK